MGKTLLLLYKNFARKMPKRSKISLFIGW